MLARAEGNGELVLTGAGLGLHPLHLGGGRLFPSHAALVACGTAISVSYEYAGFLKGRFLAAELSGAGSMILAVRGAPVVLPLLPDQPAFVRPEAVVAWTEEIAYEPEVVSELKRVVGKEEALRYRMKRGLARHEEQMALLVQRVSGAYHGTTFFPALAGVGISYNTFVWRHDIDPNAGMLRVVVGLGTRAVDRVEGDYPRVVALDQPLLVRYSDPDLRRRFTQQDIDLLDVAHNVCATVPSRELEPDATLPMSSG